MQTTRKLEKTSHFLKKIWDRLDKSTKKNEDLEKSVLFIFNLIKKSALKSGEIDFLLAQIFFLLGQKTKKQNFYLTALQRLQECQDYKKEYDLLWGKILLNLSSYSDDEKLIENAIQKFHNIFDKNNLECVWCLGISFMFLGKRSLEENDFKQSSSIFGQATYADFPLFWVDYAESLYIQGAFSSHKESLERARDIIQKIIIKADREPAGNFISYHPLYGKDSRAYARTWVLYIKTLKKIVEIEEKSVSSLDLIFFDAISSVPYERLFWLEWSELYIRQGWIKKDFVLIDKGLENISSAFFVERDKKDVSAHWLEPILFSEALATLGLFADELKLIKEAERIIRLSLETMPNNNEVWHSYGIVNLVYGLYFSDKKFFLKSVRSFKRGLEIYNRSFYLWHGLFEAYFSLAVLESDQKYFLKALEINESLLKMRPESPLLHYESALLFLQCGPHDQDLLLAACDRFDKLLSIDNDIKYFYRYAETLDKLGILTGHTMYFEKGLDLTARAREKGEHSPQIIYLQGLLFAHLGQTEEEEECLYRAHYLFEQVAQKKGEDDLFYCEWGYLLLYLAYLKDFSTKEGMRLSRRAEEYLVKSLEYGNCEAHYHLACLYSLSQQFELSLEQLQKSYEKEVLPPLSEIEQDSWLEGIRDTIAFQKFAESIL